MGFPAIDFAEMKLPVTLRFDTPVSDEQLLHFSEANRPFRMERNRKGEITIMPPVGGDGGEHEIYVATMLFNWNSSVKRGRVYSSSTGFRLPDGSCLSPDASWVSEERVRALTPEQRKGFFPLCPEFVVEIRSETDRRRTLEEKMQAWLETVWRWRGSSIRWSRASLSTAGEKRWNCWNSRIEFSVMGL